VHVSCDHGFRLLAVAWQQSPSFFQTSRTPPIEAVGGL